jgi:hypothetical protein
MGISPLGGAGPSNISGAGSAPKLETFDKVLKGQTGRPENAPLPVLQPQPSVAKSTSQVAPSKCRVAEGQAPAGVSAAKVMDRVTAAQNRMEQILSLAESGKSFSAAELLSLQTNVYRASQELDLAGKVVEKATGGVKQVLQTQV